MPQVVIRKSNTISPKVASKMFREAVKQSTPDVVIDEVLDELNRFEHQFGMSTVAFYRWYRAGKMGDSGDVIAWAAFFESYMSIVQNLDPSKVRK